MAESLLFPKVDGAFMFDVFFSFVWQDNSLNGFVGCLYEALKERELRTFYMGGPSGRKEERISDLLKAIEGSQIFIPIFSARYAACKFCLMEITKMVGYHRLILPVFYDVEPREVRNQKGPFDFIFRNHEESGEDRVKEWRDALRQAGEIKGYHIKTEAYGHEKKFIPLILKRVLKEVHRTPLDVAKYPVGLDSRMSKVMKMLDVEASGARMVGIHGMGGIGKTTLAKAIYNRLQPNFEACSFISDIKEASMKYNGLVFLQEQLIKDLAIDKVSSISSVSQGINIIERRVHSKVVLIVLDDVDHISQLDAFAGSLDWFSKKSRIIITTRYEHVLNVLKVKKRNEQFLNVQKVNPHQTYKLDELNADESLELFCYHAFQMSKPLDRYSKLSKRVVSITGGLPLALEIIGSLLFDKNSTEEWEEVLKKLEKVPIDEIQSRLELSFDGLDVEEKCIFLDIACLLSGMEKEDAMHIWRGCGLGPSIAIRVLLHKSLIKISGGNSVLHMHNQLRDMGRQIVSRESLKPGERSRLWHPDHILRVLADSEGTPNIEGIIVDFEEAKVGVQEPLRTESLAGLSKLRLFRANHANFTGDFQHFPKELRWLEWQGFPLGSLPLGIHLDKTVVLNLSKSKIMEMPCKVFNKLKVLNLSGCEHLTVTPDFSNLPFLVKLKLDGCISLVEVHKSIGHLKEVLMFFSMNGCKKLMELPNELCQLTSLRNLILSHCSKLSRLPNQLGDLVSLSNLAVGGTLLTELPNSIGRLSILENLLLDHCYRLKELPSSIGHLSKLKKLDTQNCTSLGNLPNSVGDAINLKQLFLDATALKELPDTIGLLGQLEILSLRGCKRLKALPSSMKKMRKLYSLDITESQIRELPEDFGCMRKLSILHIEQNAILGSLPASFSQLSSLSVLHVDLHNVSEAKIPKNFKNLSSLQSLTLFDSKHEELSLPQLPTSLTKLHAFNCASLARISDAANLVNLRELILTDCVNLIDVHGIEMLKSLRFLDMNGCVNVCGGLKDRLVKVTAFQYLESFISSGSLVPASFPRLSFAVPNMLRSQQRVSKLVFLLYGMPFLFFMVNVDVVLPNHEVIYTTTKMPQLRTGLVPSITEFGENEEIYGYLRNGCSIQISWSGKTPIKGTMYLNYERIDSE